MTSRSLARTSFYAACVSAMLLGMSAAPASAASPFASFFINIQARTFIVQTTVNPTKAVKRLDRLNERKPERAVSVLTQMYANDPTATNQLLSDYQASNPTAAATLVQELQDAGVPVSPT